MAANEVFAQDLQQKISLDVHDLPLVEVIHQISEKGHILFSYNPQSIPLDKKITVFAHKETLSKIFDKVFIANGIDFSVSEKQVILKPAKPAALPAETKLQQLSRFTLSGFVKDKSTGEAIIGANVYDVASYQGTTTNAYGFYSLSLPKGEYQITNSYMGYSSVRQKLELNKNTIAMVELEVAPVTMKTVEILADPEDEILQISKSGTLRLSPATLKQIPGFAGNTDVLKSLQNIPGIVTFGDGSSFYYVRGGNSDQNLLLIDEAPIYNPSHLFGFFSALAPDAIKDVMVYKGDFPAGYGGRLSSVVDVRAREGNMKRLGFAGNIGPFTSDLTIEGPIWKEKSSFLISGRRSNLNWLKLERSQSAKKFLNFSLIG